MVLFFCAQVLFVLSSFVFAVSAVDDLFIDAFFYISATLKKFFHSGADTKALNFLMEASQQPIAIMLPAWQEYDVISKSVSKLIGSLDYQNYHVFIGTYPNDEKTQHEVDLLTREFDRVKKVVTALPGPTCKADCLNYILRSITAFERTAAVAYAGFVLQDAEDIVHPSSLKIFNAYLADYDLVQIPVYSLKRKWNDLTGGHYMDEFAEFQNKEIRVRELLAKVVPGAGVGTAYSRRAIMAFLASGEVFNTSSLTEDYEFSLRLHAAGFRQVFARALKKQRPDGSPLYEQSGIVSDHAADCIATREYFPNRFWAAVRQKTRWTIGISLQGWKNFRWRGDWRIRYFFWRDRKMLFFAQAIAAGFFSLILFAGYNAYRLCFSNGYRFAPLLAEDSWIWYLVHFNLSVMAIRILQRGFWTYSLYGWSCLPLLPVRYMWGSVINYLAVIRAIRIFLSHLRSGRTIGWDKTAHDYPDAVDSAMEPLVVQGPFVSGATNREERVELNA
jgi:adsorption protein B